MFAASAGAMTKTLRIIFLTPSRVVRVTFARPPRNASQWSDGAILAGGAEWGCVSPVSGKASSFVRRVTNAKWPSPLLLVVETTEGRFGDAFDTVDVRLGASAEASEQSQAASPVVHSPTSPATRTEGKAVQVRDGEGRSVRQSCTTPSFSGDLTWVEPYSGAIFLSPGVVSFEFTTTNIIQGDCITLYLYEDISGGFGTTRA